MRISDLKIGDGTFNLLSGSVDVLVDICVRPGSAWLCDNAVFVNSLDDDIQEIFVIPGEWKLPPLWKPTPPLLKPEPEPNFNIKWWQTVLKGVGSEPGINGWLHEWINCPCGSKEHQAGGHPEESK